MKRPVPRQFYQSESRKVVATGYDIIKRSILTDRDEPAPYLYVIRRDVAARTGTRARSQKKVRAEDRKTRPSGRHKFAV